MYAQVVGRPKESIDPALERAILRAMRHRESAETELNLAVSAALEAGTAPAAVARVLGVSRQAVDQRKKRSEAR